MRENKPQQAKPSQSGKFIAAAREAGCDESEAAFEQTLKKLGKRKPALAPKAEKKKDNG